MGVALTQGGGAPAEGARSTGKPEADTLAGHEASICRERQAWLMARSMRRRRTDAIWIIAAGAVVAAAPAFWYSRVWPNQPDATTGAGGWLFLFGFSVAPFVLLAALRGRGRMGRLAALIGSLAGGALIVLGQVAGLNPNDPSSTASIALVTVPIYACVAVGLIFGAEQLIRALVSFKRSHSNRRQ
jgi:peptidoglycan/LPS O-acetylase OafA/YrhL